MANEEKYLKPIHPGEVLNMEYLQPLKLSQNKLARDIGYRLVGSIRLCTANGRLQQIQL